MKRLFRLLAKIIAVIAALYLLTGIGMVIFNPYLGQYAPEWLVNLPYRPPSQCIHDACTQIGYIIHRTNWVYWQLSPQSGYIPFDLWVAGIVLGISSIWLYITRTNRSRVPLIKAAFLVACLYVVAGLLAIMSEGGLTGRFANSKEDCKDSEYANSVACTTTYIDDQYHTFIGWKFQINAPYEGQYSYTPADLQVAGLIAAGSGLALLLRKRKLA
jgi:hypothetical protein